MTTAQLTMPQPPTGLVVDGVAWGPLAAPAAPTPPPAPAPPPASAPYPAGWNRPGITWTEFNGPIHPTMFQEIVRFASINDTTGLPSIMADANGYNGFDLETFRIKTREGPRGAGAHITLRDGYLEVHAEAGDHADGTQMYGGSGVTIAASKLLAGGGGATCIFAADNSHGAIDIDGSYFGALPGYSKPGFLIRVNLDGADSFGISNTVVERGVTTNSDLFVDAKVPITRWLNVVDQFGKPWARPH